MLCSNLVNYACCKSIRNLTSYLFQRNIIEHTESPSSLSSVFSCECQHTESYKQSQPDSSHSSDDSESLYVSPTEVYTQGKFEILNFYWK